MLAAQSMQCLAEGLFTATYKFALLAALADLCDSIVKKEAIVIRMFRPKTERYELSCSVRIGLYQARSLIVNCRQTPNVVEL